MKDGVSVTPVGREMVQLRVTLSPATMEEEGEESRDMLAGSVYKGNETVNFRMIYIEVTSSFSCVAAPIQLTQLH